MKRFAAVLQKIPFRRKERENKTIIKGNTNTNNILANIFFKVNRKDKTEKKKKKSTFHY